jgi:two-component system alkaline phosphatase synthesis response regulator PhoP
METLSHRKKILLIDDEPELIKAVEIRLKSTGYEVALSYDGRTGIDKAKEIKPDLILLDLIMPIMDGYSVAKY